jgi:cation:H+ antiporter
VSSEAAMVWLVLQFIVCAGIIATAGVFLVKFGDVIAERLELGRLWAGAILIATATSLPELFTGASSILIFDLPDLAVSTIFGSCVFNLLLLVMLDFLLGKRSFFDGVNPSYIVEAAFVLLLTLIEALGFVFSAEMTGFPWIWPGSLVVFVVYIFAVHVTLREGRYPPYVQDIETCAAMDARAEPKGEKADSMRALSLRKAVPGYFISAALVIAAALWLPGVAEQIADRAGIGTTVLGGIAVALTTSLPEIATTLAAFRIGAVDMAFSNVIGSNMFNILILAIEDMMYLKGPITSLSSPVNLVTALVAIGMTGVAIIALAVRKQRKFLRLSIASWVLIAGFILNSVAISAQS